MEDEDDFESEEDSNPRKRLCTESGPPEEAERLQSNEGTLPSCEILEPESPEEQKEPSSSRFFYIHFSNGVAKVEMVGEKVKNATFINETLETKDHTDAENAERIEKDPLASTNFESEKENAMEGQEKAPEVDIGPVKSALEREEDKNTVKMKESSEIEEDSKRESVISGGVAPVEEIVLSGDEEEEPEARKSQKVHFEFERDADKKTLNLAVKIEGNCEIDDDSEKDSDSVLNEVGEEAPLNEEIILSGDEEEEPEAEQSSSIYNTRKRQKVDYYVINNGFENDEEGNPPKKNILDVFSLKEKGLKNLLKNQGRVEQITYCKLSFLDGTSDKMLNLVEKLIKKIKDQVETLTVHMNGNERSFAFLEKILKSSNGLEEFWFKYTEEEGADQVLNLLGALRSGNHLQKLHSLKLTSAVTEGPEVSLKEEQVKKLYELDIPFRSLELGDSLWQDVKPETVEGLLQKNKDSLEKLVIHGGFSGREGNEKRIKIPGMTSLRQLSICPVYTFVSEEPEVESECVDLEKEAAQVKNCEVGITFTGRTPALRRLELGNIEIEDLQFSTLKEVKRFKCGGGWNLLNFPPNGVRQKLMESNVTELQFPDRLKDISFPGKVAKYFPNLKKVWVFLPTVPVLQAFFKAFANSKVEELYLQTQFDFKSTLESCLMPDLENVTRLDRKQESVLKALKEYKHFEDFVRFHNIQLPVTEEDLTEGHFEGIRALKNLKLLELQHIPRTLRIPEVGETRKWFDSRCEFGKSIGLQFYPLSVQFCKELIDLNLESFIWRKNFKICESLFRKAGYFPWPFHKGGKPEKEDIFTPFITGSGAGAVFKIMPALLVPDVKRDRKRSAI